jgi:hypothetical protein
VPEPTKAKQQFWRKVKWLAIGLFAPELVAWVAFKQNQKAQKLRAEINSKLGLPILPRKAGIWKQILHKMSFKKKIKNEDAPPEVELDVEGALPQRRHPWTMTHGHYGAMGGFAADLSETKPNFHPKGYTKHILPDRWLLVLARCSPESIPDIPESEILDKSKASGLAKMLVCLQALWFCVQCLNRLIQRFPISLLELNTFAHAVCTVVIYALWWHKPLDIEEPTLLREETVVELSAWLLSKPIHASLGVKNKNDDSNEVRFKEGWVHGLWWRLKEPPSLEEPSNSPKQSIDPSLSDAQKEEYDLKFPKKPCDSRVYAGD